MEALNQAIGDRVTGCCSDSGSSKEVGERSEEGAFELWTAICGENGGYAKYSNPVFDELFCSGLCGDVGDRSGFRPTRKSVDTCENVRVAIGRWKWATDVYVNVGKPLGGDVKIRKRSTGMTLNFGTLTLEACSCPFPYIGVNVGPNVAFSE